MKLKAYPISESQKNRQFASFNAPHKVHNFAANISKLWTFSILIQSKQFAATRRGRPSQSTPLPCSRRDLLRPHLLCAVGRRQPLARRLNGGNLMPFDILALVERTELSQRVKYSTPRYATGRGYASTPALPWLRSRLLP